MTGVSQHWALAPIVLQALREELGHMIAADSSSKALVFSQFTSMLDLCHFRLQQVRME